SPRRRFSGQRSASARVALELARAHERRDRRVVAILDPSLDDAGELPARRKKSLHRQRDGLVRDAEGREPARAELGVRQPVGSAHAGGLGLVREEAQELALVVVERDKEEIDEHAGRSELALKAEQPGHLLFAGGTPSGPEVHPGPFADPEREQRWRRALARG